MQSESSEEKIQTNKCRAAAMRAGAKVMMNRAKVLIDEAEELILLAQRLDPK